jgi:hypothetical protein
MIERVVLMKLQRSYLTDQALAQIEAHSLEVLAALPGVRHVHVGVAADDATASDWDISLVLHFDSIQDVEQYRIHPDHRVYVSEYLTPRIDAIRAINFEIGAGDEGSQTP